MLTGHRNRAIGHMLRTFGMLVDDPEAALELYFRQCSVSVDCRDMGLMAATLANGGVHPMTGERAFEPHTVEPVLSVMTTCGMYDGAGEWVERVGMPAPASGWNRSCSVTATTRRNGPRMSCSPTAPPRTRRWIWPTVSCAGASPPII